MRTYSFYIYMVTNPRKTSLYIGVTNDLPARLQEHYENRGKQETWAGRYYCYNLIYFEQFQYIDKAIAREKQLKNWSRKKKEFLINKVNPKWNSLNAQFPFKVDSSTRPTQGRGRSE